MNDFGVGSPGCCEAGLLPFSGAYTPSPHSKALTVAPTAPSTQDRVLSLTTRTRTKPSIR